MNNFLTTDSFSINISPNGVSIDELMKENARDDIFQLLYSNASFNFVDGRVIIVPNLMLVDGNSVVKLSTTRNHKASRDRIKRILVGQILSTDKTLALVKPYTSHKWSMSDFDLHETKHFNWLKLRFMYTYKVFIRDEFSIVLDIPISDIECMLDNKLTLRPIE